MGDLLVISQEMGKNPQYIYCENLKMVLLQGFGGSTAQVHVNKLCPEVGFTSDSKSSFVLVIEMEN